MFEQHERWLEESKQHLDRAESVTSPHPKMWSFGAVRDREMWGRLRYVVN